jgi:hypothetical protein
MNKLSETSAKMTLGVKTCGRCSFEKLISEFSNDKSRKDGKNPRCKSCDSVYFANRPNKTREKEVERRESGRYNDYYVNWRKSNKEKIRDFNKNYRLLNSDKRNSLESKRRAAKLNATPSWLTEQHLVQIEAIYSHARDCRLVTGEPYHVDHIVPLQGRNVCGLHVPWNLQVLPADVNVRKNNRYEQAE